MQLGQLGLGSEKLIRNLPVEHRQLYREDTLRNYKLKTNRAMTGREVVVVVEEVENGYWRNKAIVAQQGFEMGRLSNSRVFKKTDIESVAFCTAKGKRMLSPGMLLGEVHSKHRDSDDNMLYLRLVRPDAF